MEQSWTINILMPFKMVKWWNSLGQYPRPYLTCQVIPSTGNNKALSQPPRLMGWQRPVWMYRNDKHGACQYKERSKCSGNTETKMLSLWQNFLHWLHCKLSKRQLTVQLVMKISSKWWHFHFSINIHSISYEICIKKLFYVIFLWWVVVIDSTLTQMN